MKYAVFSNSTFLRDDSRLGLQIIAQHLAQRGHQVDYFATPSSPWDFLSPSRRRTFKRAWFFPAEANGYRVEPGLTEYSLRAPFSRHKRFWKSKWQIDFYSSLMPNWLQKQEYDVCLCDTAFSSWFSSRIRARNTVLRLNDNPEGFAGFMHPMLVDDLKRKITEGHFDLIWPVSDYLAKWARKLHPSVPVSTYANGVDWASFQQAPEVSRTPQSAVYVGRFNQWFDFDLLSAAADCLPDWQIDLYGTPPRGRVRKIRPNVEFKGYLPYANLPKVLKGYQVGLIPFTGDERLMQAIDPLKFNQYLAAGLGVASTAQGRLKELAGTHAEFGDEGASFAQAMVRAGEKQANETVAEKQVIADWLQKRSWPAIVDQMEADVEKLKSVF